MTLSNGNETIKFHGDELLELFDDQFSLKAFEEKIDKRSDESNKIINEVERVVSSKENNDDIKLVVDLTDEMKEAYKNGELKLDVSKDGKKMYAQIKENGKYGSKLSISEELENKDISIDDVTFAAELSSIKEQLKEMTNMLEDIEGYVFDTLNGLHNDRIGLFYSGLSIYVEALQVNDLNLKTLLISQSIKSLSDAQSQMIQELKYDINYLVNHEYKHENNRHKIIGEKMNNIHKCYEVIHRAAVLKAMIYFDNRQLQSTFMVFEEYARFINTLIKPNADFLIECDSREDKLINGIWKRRSNFLDKCKEVNNIINSNTLYYIKEI